ncbi:hypothetical protein GCM10010349_23070 [Streptomyces flavofungini]|nr:hypothetical protein GCM10010349_23070 [Streptomyces flavofungini]
MAPGHSIEPTRWRDAFEGLMGRIAGRFARVEPRCRAARLALGLWADLPRKNCWTIAEWAGETTPDGMQDLLGRAKWDADQVRDDVCGYVVEHLHDDRAVLVVDETGDVKKGTGTVGVQRQYTGTAGRIEHSQVAVYLGAPGDRAGGTGLMGQGEPRDGVRLTKLGLPTDIRRHHQKAPPSRLERLPYCGGRRREHMRASCATVRNTYPANSNKHQRLTDPKALARAWLREHHQRHDTLSAGN